MDFGKSLKDTLNFSSPEMICQFEPGYWPETLKRWREEGLGEDEDPWGVAGITFYHHIEKEVKKILGCEDAGDRVW